MLKDLPLSLISVAEGIIEEDALAAQDIPGETEPEKQLSGKKEEVVINPEYKAFSRRTR